MDPEREPDRVAWHRAHAAAGPDESIAAELERSASRAEARGGVAAAAAFLERAAELSPDPANRGTRALAAAWLKLEGGAAEAAERLVAVATTSPLDELDFARAERLRALIAYARTRGSDTPSLLSTAAKRLEPLDPELARETHLGALLAAVRRGRFALDTSIVEAAEAATLAAGQERARAIGRATGSRCRTPDARVRARAVGTRDCVPSCRGARTSSGACSPASSLWSSGKTTSRKPSRTPSLASRAKAVASGTFRSRSTTRPRIGFSSASSASQSNC
jgi:hypothetical protein